MSLSGWIGVDLDGTLAHYEGWQGVGVIGDPIPAMFDRVKSWLAEGREVRIFTARVGGADYEEARYHIFEWQRRHFGAVVMQVTATKDFGMMELWDDRCKQVIPNTGKAVEDMVIDAYHQVEALFESGAIPRPLSPVTDTPESLESFAAGFFAARDAVLRLFGPK